MSKATETATVSTGNINLTCPVPQCSYATGSVPQMAAVALLTAHTTVHSAANAPTHHSPKLDRPRVDIGVAAEDWKLFESRWKLYVKSTSIPLSDRATQLFHCLSDQLGDAVLRICRNVVDSTEDELLKVIKSLAVIPVSTIVMRAELIAMRQNRDEPYRSFFARVRGKADSCSYNTNHKCDCGKVNVVDFTEIITRDVVIAGINDEDIRRRIMGISDISKKSANDIVAVVESEEMARDSISSSHHPPSPTPTQHESGPLTSKSTTVADVKRIDQNSKHRDRREKVPCPHCKNLFHQFKKGKYGWNKTPHKMCSECFQQQKNSKPSGQEKQFDNSSIAQMSSVSSKRNIGKNHHLQQPHQSAQIQLSHHIYSKGRWKRKDSAKHPRVNLTLSVDHSHYASFNMKCPSIPDLTVECVADTGAQSNLWSLKECMRMGFTKKDLIPVKTSLAAANKSRIHIDGAIIVTLSGTKDDGDVISCPAMIYISSSADAFYLCHESMLNLGIIPQDFPSVGAAQGLHNCQIQVNTDTPKLTAELCSCPRRQAVPPRPDRLPFKCSPDNIGKMRDWLLQTYGSSTFNKCPHQHLPCMTGPPVEIHLDPKAVPRVCHTPATVPLHWQEKVKADLERDVALGVIERVPYGEPVTWCHRMVVARKHDGTPRRTVDMSPLNKYCSRETFATESPFHLARKVPKETWKTVSDAWNGYHSVPLRESDRHLTTFITPFGRFRYKRAPQGFVSSGDGYNRRFDAILSDFERKERCVDDTVHYDEDLEQHWWRTIDFLRKVGESGIVLNPDKFQFCQKSVEFAGFRVGNSVIEPLPKYLDAIRDFPTPNNITDIRSWFGLVNQVSNYAQLREVMAPFRPFLSPKNPFQWSPELEESFQKSKEAIIEAITKGVEIFDLKKHTCLRPDWSKQGIGYFLLQKYCDCISDLPDCCANGWRIVLAGSRFLSSAEQRYAPIEGEALAVAWGLEQSKYFTQGCEHLLVVTDHKPLVKILGDRTLDEITNTRLFRLKQRTLPWRFSIAHLPGKSNHAADATSRNPSPRINDFSDDVSNSLRTSHDEVEVCHIAAITDDVSAMFSLQWSDLREATAADAVLYRLVYLIENGFPEQRSKLPDELAVYWRFKEALYVHDGVIMYEDRVVIPTSLRSTVGTLLHAAHQGVSMMESRARAIVFWPGMSQDIQKVRDACLHCCRNAPSQAATPAMAPHIPSTPFESIVADYFESHGHMYLVVADRLSGWVEIFSSQSKSFTSGAAGLISHLRSFFKVFGVPEELSSDGGPQFKAMVTKEFLAKWGIRHRVSSAYFPQSNGRAEVAVKTAKRLLLDNIDPSGSIDNDKFLRAMLQLRNTPDIDCNLSPAQIVFGRTLSDAFKFVNRVVKYRNPDIRPMWREAWRAKETALRTRFTRSMEQLNAKARSLPPLCPGERVFVQNQTGSHPTKWDRSGTVVDVQGHDQYLIKVDGSGRLTVRNRRFLRRYTAASPTIRCPQPLPIQDDCYQVSPEDKFPHMVQNSVPDMQGIEPTITPPVNPDIPDKSAPTSSQQTLEGQQEPTVNTPSSHEQEPVQNTRPRRERRQPKVYDAHSGTWVAP